MEENQTNYFIELNKVNVNDKTEKKGGLTYLSWAWAWGELKKRHPDAFYTIYENAEGLFYHHDGKTAWVKTGVTVNGIEHIEYLPVMDYKNQSVPLDKITSTAVNKTIQRSLTKAVARHGLGLYIYAGEDLPDDGEIKTEQAKEEKITKKEQIVLANLCQKKGLNPAQVFPDGLENLTAAQYVEASKKLSERPDKA
jgi:hypothetical protein